MASYFKTETLDPDDFGFRRQELEGYRLKYPLVVGIHVSEHGEGGRPVMAVYPFVPNREIDLNSSDLSHASSLNQTEAIERLLLNLAREGLEVIVDPDGNILTPEAAQRIFQAIVSREILRAPTYTPPRDIPFQL